MTLLATMSQMKAFVVALLLGAAGATAWANRDGLLGREADPPATAATAAPPTELHVQASAERTNIYNKPWDGIGHLGTILGPFLPDINIESPPDLILCVVSRNEVSCLQDGTEKEPLSYCHDAYRCEWTISTPTGGPFALIVYDTDTYFGREIGDLVDAVIINQDGSDAGPVEETARQLIEQVAPTTFTLPGENAKQAFTWRKGEQKRRARPFVQIGFTDCAETCTLQQSDLVVTP